MKKPRKMTCYIGRSPDGVRRLFAQDQNPARAMADAFDAGRDYIKGRPDCAPLENWSFLPATILDMKAVMYGQEKGSQLIIHNDVKERSTRTRTDD